MGKYNGRAAIKSAVHSEGKQHHTVLSRVTEGLRLSPMECVVLRREPASMRHRGVTIIKCNVSVGSSLLS